MSRPRRDRTRLLLIVTSVAAVVSLVVAAFALGSLNAAAPTIAPARVQEAGAARADAAGRVEAKQVGAPARVADYSFGHTLNRVETGGGAEFEASMRLPFELAVDATAFRVHVRNWQFNTEQSIDSPVTLTGVYVGEHRIDGPDGQTGEFGTAPVEVGGTANLAREGFVSGWIDPGTQLVAAHTPYLLSIGFTAPAGATLATNPGLSWLATGVGASTDAAAIGTPRAERSADLSYFDVWIEYEFAGDAPVLLSIGHSLNAPGTLSPAEHPTRGEQTAWPQQWAISNDAVAVSLAAPGSLSSLFAGGSELWQQYGDDLEPDIVTVWAASNDIARGRQLADIQNDWGAVVTRVRTLWPDATVYAMTEPPRALSGAEESTRLAWNAWLSTLPYGIDRVVDADFLLRDPQQPDRLRSDVDADGIHFTARGHSLIAAQIPAPRHAR
ncbi:SGNH/GDSL hydrolase family protein [Herbiconiux sp. A18JL235]|uniref:SGNH/GDSL hydrolase family protein n=1 Tax=Herbiconiux sp. A18JL235 TaxID=3152363 RepID=A0AB39BGL2_9MICO